MATKTVMMIDPPSGWKYGFPKPIDLKESKGRVLEWLVENGYPQKEIDACGGHFYCRYFEHEVDDDWSLTVYDESDGEWVNKHIESRKKDTNDAN